MTDAKSIEQVHFEKSVGAAVLKIAVIDAIQLELVDLIAKDLFSGGDPDGYSTVDRMKWDDLRDTPIFTRGDTTHPAKLQWRLKALRVVDITGTWLQSKVQGAAVLMSKPADLPAAGEMH